MNKPKTIFCDIDGTILEHKGDIIKNYKEDPSVLNNVIDTFKSWEKNNFKIILITGRKESTRKYTEKQLQELGIIYDELIMGLPNGDRIIINDRKPNDYRNTTYAINVVRNKGLGNIDLLSNYITIPDKFLYDRAEKPWGYEELVECNDKYVVKKLFMKKDHACSIQYHELKTESILVFSGVLAIYIGTSLDNLEKKIYYPGQTITIKPYTVHRMEAVEDCVYYETSTNELWDVVRLQDLYGRSS
jgi:mannose-6-phosphate isomerase-like protein (cupin superfamily)